ncbi:hypothetical protein CIB48_g11484 [Xylaria polymorpha]|nr:hypothetical protein CIB48_g11484 [Xylaria polymorpha]
MAWCLPVYYQYHAVYGGLQYGHSQVDEFARRQTLATSIDLAVHAPAIPSHLREVGGTNQPVWPIMGKPPSPDQRSLFHEASLTVLPGMT